MKTAKWFDRSMKMSIALFHLSMYWALFCPCQDPEEITTGFPLILGCWQVLIRCTEVGPLWSRLCVATGDLPLGKNWTTVVSLKTQGQTRSYIADTLLRRTGLGFWLEVTIINVTGKPFELALCNTPLCTERKSERSLQRSRGKKHLTLPPSYTNTDDL